jgi:hypothetical protein
VLQSALADHALESANEAGITVDTVVMKKSKVYQKSNFDTATKSAVTGKAAGVMLYSLSSTTRSSAKEARKAKQIIEKGKKEGKLSQAEVLNEEVVSQSGRVSCRSKRTGHSEYINEHSKQESDPG